MSRRAPTSLTLARAVPLFSLSAGALDPFETLAVDSSRLQVLLGNHKARQAPEPVFSVVESLEFQNFRAVFRTGLVDPALLNAVMLSFAFAVTEGSIDRECLGYQGKAISFIRERMNSLDEAASESTIGTILLLAGVEARLGTTSQVQLHMGAVQRLLEICRSKGVYLTGGIKRAIFWQDLNSSVLAGSHRIVDHTTFAELEWTRDPFSPSFFRPPPGFQRLSHLLTRELIEVIEDINALQCIRDVVPQSKRGDVMMMANINNHIASIQSRLVGLPALSPVLKCCHLAAYLCSVMLCCTIWCALVIPSHLSSQLLQALQQARDDPV
ncbi:Uu.00g083890.m01.CDS01 [Anthostomella pinea]|uniref:Uu.00g083890.m01.CDS01 n=1 Tax=Anthostomella pinea TaxID=933095 RepID=A0AAI8YJS6_9PEZI|nr:Uu.00g083890.m01.CDS01 [Anthostomella pinea]